MIPPPRLYGHIAAWLGQHVPLLAGPSVGWLTRAFGVGLTGTFTYYHRLGCALPRRLVWDRARCEEG